MVDNVRVTYGFSVGKVPFNRLIKQVSVVAKSYEVDFDLRLTKNSVTINVYPYKHSSAKEITEINGAQIMCSLVKLCDKYIHDGVLWSVEMATALPF